MPDASPAVCRDVAGRADPATAAVRFFSDRRCVAPGGGVDAIVRAFPLRRRDLDASLRRLGLATSAQPLLASTGGGRKIQPLTPENRPGGPFAVRSKIGGGFKT